MAKQQTTPTQPQAASTRLCDLPEWRAAVAKVDQLTDKQKANADKIRKLRFALDNRPDPIDAKAAALVRGQAEFEKTEDAAKELEEASERQLVLDRAVALAAQERDDLQRKLSRQVCEAAKPKHQELLFRIARAAEELGSASRDELAFRNELQRGGAQIIGLHAGCFAGFVYPDDERAGTMLSTWLRNMVDVGALPADAIEMDASAGWRLTEKYRAK